MSRIIPCLWFDTQGEEAAALYTSIFKNSRILHTARYGEAGPRPAGTVMTVSFELDGQKFVALNGGPEFTFTEAVSFQIDCRSQEEVDHYWSRLGDGGQEGPCGWLKDRFGVSWQIVPTRLSALLGDPDPETSQRVMRSMLEMKKIDTSQSSSRHHASARVARRTAPRTAARERPLIGAPTMPAGEPAGGVLPRRPALREPSPAGAARR